MGSFCTLATFGCHSQNAHARLLPTGPAKRAPAFASCASYGGQGRRARFAARPLHFFRAAGLALSPFFVSLGTREWSAGRRQAPSRRSTRNAANGAMVSLARGASLASLAAFKRRHERKICSCYVLTGILSTRAREASACVSESVPFRRLRSA
jgi:hypothetical protein